MEVLSEQHIHTFRKIMILRGVLNNKYKFLGLILSVDVFHTEDVIFLYLRIIRLLRIRMKRRRNLLDHVKKLNKEPNWLWKREIGWHVLSEH